MANIQHKTLAAANLHAPGYVQGTDPGAVGTGILWIDTSGGTGLWVVRVRNATNTGWEVVAGGYSGYSGISGYSGSGGSGGGTYITSFTNANLVNGVLSITHGLNDRVLHAAVYNNSYEMVIPDEVISTGLNTATLSLVGYGTITGTWSLKLTK